MESASIHASLPTLYLNSPEGAPGSSFLVGGYHFPAGATVRLSLGPKCRADGRARSSKLPSTR